MKFEQYKFKFYLNANHAIEINGKMGQAHPHTWEISIVSLKLSDEFIRFNEIETIIDSIFDQYQNKFINEIEPFNMINPTLENICEVFKDKIYQLSNNSDWKLLHIEVSETPARSYVIDLSNDDHFQLETANADKLDSDSKEFLITEILNECKQRKNK